MVIFHCYVSSPEGKFYDMNWLSGVSLCQNVLDNIEASKLGPPMDPFLPSADQVLWSSVTFFRNCFIWFLLIGNECFEFFCCICFNRFMQFLKKTSLITHHLSGRAHHSGKKIQKKMEMSWNIQGIRIVFFKRLRFASRFSGCWWAHLCPVSDCHRRVARNFSWGSPSNVRFLKGKIWQ